MKRATTHRELRFEMPRVLLEAFAEQPRIVLDPAPGLWPVDLRVLPLLEKLVQDEKFNAKFEILIVPK
jgi:hypothetical protein